MLGEYRFWACTRSTARQRNIYHEGFRPRATEQQIPHVARIALPLFTQVVLYFTLIGGATFATLAIFSSSLPTQLLPMFTSSS